MQESASPEGERAPIQRGVKASTLRAAPLVLLPTVLRWRQNRGGRRADGNPTHPAQLAHRTHLDDLQPSIASSRQNTFHNPAIGVLGHKHHLGPAFADRLRCLAGSDGLELRGPQAVDRLSRLRHRSPLDIVAGSLSGTRRRHPVIVALGLGGVNGTETQKQGNEETRSAYRLWVSLCSTEAS